MIELQHVSKTFETVSGSVEAVRDVNLTIQDGDIFGVIGLSGAGKSTLVRCINFLERPTDGKVLFSCVDLASLSKKQLLETRRKIAMIFQNFNLLAQRSALANVCYPMEITGVPKKKAIEKAKALLERVGLADRMNSYPAQLSGGQKQRVAMARMLAAEPELILLDEPFSALDTYLKWQLEQEMYKHLKEAGKPVIFVSHNRDEVYRLCDTVSCMNRGKMEVMEPLKEFFQNPKTRTAAILSGCKNISAAERVDAHTLRAVDWGVTLHVKEREIADDIRAVGIRAHFLATVERPGEENVFPVNESEIWEDPFEWNISFRKNAECSWLQWKIAKTDWSPEMGIPKELYLKEEDILLLTDS